jgi:uncharacterized protein YndB with AHSA1/START domain
MPTQGTFQITIAAPPEKVWPWVADLSKHGEWSPRPYHVQLVSGEADVVGSRYRSVGWVPPNDNNHANDVVITEVAPMTRFALEATDSNGTFTSTFDLAPVGAGTEVTHRLVFPPLRGIAAILVPVVFPLVGKADIRKRMKLLKAKAEQAV